MEPERYVETGSGSFYGEYLYDQVVAKDHFFVKAAGSGGLGISFLKIFVFNLW